MGFDIKGDVISGSKIYVNSPIKTELSAPIMVSFSFLKVNIILKLVGYEFLHVTQDEVYKEVLEQAENCKKYSGQNQ